jgi:hypothetical protein
MRRRGTTLVALLKDRRDRYLGGLVGVVVVTALLTPVAAQAGKATSSPAARPAAHLVGYSPVGAGVPVAMAPGRVGRAVPVSAIRPASNYRRRPLMVRNAAAYATAKAGGRASGSSTARSPMLPLASASAAPALLPVLNSGVTVTPTGTATTMFVGASVDSAHLLDPPDTIVAVSSALVVEMVNTVMFTRDRTTQATATCDLRGWFGLDDPVGPNADVTDPQVYWDEASGHFFASIVHLVLDSAGNVVGSGVRLAVSHTNAPTCTTGMWTAYDLGDSTTQAFDQPKLGVSVDSSVVPNGGLVTLAWNEFNLSTGNFVQSTVAVFPKTGVISGTPGLGHLNSDPNRFGAVPALQTTSDADGFTVFNNANGTMGVLEYIPGTNIFRVATLGIAATNAPPQAVQPAGGVVIPGCTGPCIDTGDHRSQSAAWANSTMWTGLNDACDPGGGTRACLRLDQLTVSDTAAGVRQDGDVGVPGYDLYYPSVTIDGPGNMVVGFSVSSSFLNPSLAASGQGASGSNLAGVRVLDTPGFTYQGFRWGDYSGIALDPADPTKVWVAGEETNSAPRSPYPNWTTEIEQIGLIAATGTPSGTLTPPFQGLGCCGASGSGPAASSWAPGRLDVFVRGTDNQIWHKFYAGGWSTFSPLGGGTMDSPAAVSWGNGRIDVFVRGTDNQLWHTWYANGWSGWEPLGGGLASGPAVTTWGPGRLDVFVRGTDNQLWHKWYANGWSGWQPLGGILASAPGAVAWGPGRIDVFAKGNDAGLWHTAYAGAWSVFQGLGGDLASAPAVSSWAPGRLDVWVHGPGDNALYHLWYGNSGAQPVNGWSLWTDQGGGLAGPPGAVSWGSERQDVFVTGPDMNLYHTWAAP